MSSIKKLAGQTVWYGASSIVARFINYLLTPYLTLKLTTAQYGEQVLVYSFIPFMNILFTHGMETAFFRFTQNRDKKSVYNTSSISLIFSSLLLSLLLIVFINPAAKLIRLENHPEYILLAALIIGLDALTTIPFAKLRLDGRPRKFAFVKITGIVVNVLSLYFFLSICPAIVKNDPQGFIATFYKEDWKVGYVFVANFIQALVTLLLLSKEFLGFKFKFDKPLWRTMIIYALPIMIAGFGGMINETFDRIMLGWWSTAGSEHAIKEQVGIYGAVYKLSILITLAVQAFRMGAEPFFFNQSKSDNAPKIYARVMKFFVITLCLMFLAVVLYMNIWKQFIQNPKMWVGLSVVPILLLANMFLGIYYNLSIWYKLGNKTMAGAYITLIGAVVTLVINYLFIPKFGYTACAWATFACYGLMMVISYFWGQKNYPVPYAWKKLLAYIILAVMIYTAHYYITKYFPNVWLYYILATVLFAMYTLFILKVERREFQRMPVIGKFLK
ncbi:MAG: polysaccharide biosynthesis protein [Sphingobacteriales bacterium 41-5]|nr:MAG: polysaccharide biosynthesis protein [Sphingobacteriales bacterium 41-5]